MIQFFMAMKSPPTVTHQEKQVHVVRKTVTENGRPVVRHVPVFYEPPELQKARSQLMAHLMKHRPKEPLTGGIMLTVKWLFPKGSHADGEYRITPPDTDNLNKLLKDCMTAAGFWKDDAQVASEHIEKFWAETTGIYIRLEVLT